MTTPQQPPPPGSSPPNGPANMPPPDSIPKLPDTIFNLEKKGGGDTGERRGRS
jgi:hypothetical protein